MNLIMNLNKKIILIFTNNYTIISAKLLSRFLKKININSRIYNTFISQDIINYYKNNPNIYYFIFGPQYQLYRPDVNILLPVNKYYLYQIEQLNQDVNRWQNVTMIANYIENSICTFDYSLANHFYYSSHIKDKFKLLYPFLEENIEKERNENRNDNIDILFIGTVNLPDPFPKRRLNIINLLKKKYNIHVVEKVFNEELQHLLLKSKIVLNLHAYENGLLELFRIHEVMPYDVKIISEITFEHSLIKKYKDFIDFIPIINKDLSNIDNLFSIIDINLNDVNLNKNDKKYKLDFIKNLNNNNLNFLKSLI